MKIAIVGSRSIDNRGVEIHHWMVTNMKAGDVLVSGGAKGVDSIAETWAKDMGFETNIIYPNWDHYGRAAGMIRNTEIVKQADKVVAFWDGKSKGTYDTITKALAHRKNLEVIICE